MIETFKILTWKYDRAAIPVMQGADCSVTRGHDLRLLKYRTKYDLRKYYYAALLPRRGPHIASHSVCPSVRPSH